MKEAKPVDQMSLEELATHRYEKLKQIRKHQAIARRSPEENRQLLELMRELYGMKS